MTAACQLNSSASHLLLRQELIRSGFIRIAVRRPEQRQRQLDELSGGELTDQLTVREIHPLNITVGRDARHNPGDGGLLRGVRHTVGSHGQGLQLADEDADLIQHESYAGLGVPVRAASDIYFHYNDKYLSRLHLLPLLLSARGRLPRDELLTDVKHPSGPVVGPVVVGGMNLGHDIGIAVASGLLDGVEEGLEVDVLLDNVVDMLET